MFYEWKVPYNSTLLQKDRRFYAACKAMEGLLAIEDDFPIDHKELVESAYKIANEMLEQENEGKQTEKEMSQNKKEPTFRNGNDCLTDQHPEEKKYPYIVLQIEGKRDDIERFKVKLFEDKHAAEVYCEQVTDRSKYFILAQIVEQGQSLVLEVDEEQFFPLRVDKFKPVSE